MPKNSNRDEFSAATKLLLERQAGHHCANPSCRRLTSAASSDGKTRINIGEAAHITAAAPGGPRYDETLTSDERKSVSNGIWLCKIDARAVDSQDPYFTVERLKEWKQDANRAAWRAINENAPFPPLPLPPSDGDLRARLRQAAETDLDVLRKASNWPSSEVPLTLKIDQINEHLTTKALAKAVTAFEDLILVAAPGMGKTTTIYQVSEGVIADGSGAPIVILLGEWASQGGGLLDSVLKRSAYAGISESDFRQAATGPGVVLLLDGWNELDTQARERARIEIVRLKAELPELGLVVSTRRQALDVPFAGTRVDLLPLGDDQQMAIARNVRGDAGAALVDEAWRTPGVRELVAIPLYLTSLLALPDGEPFPTTKEEVLRRFVLAQEQEARKRATLGDATAGFQAVYLAKLAVAMTAQANTSIADSDARRAVSSVTKLLIDDGQLTFATTQPDALLDALVSAHVMVRAGDAAGLSFQHQQFQEWFASHEAEESMFRAVADTSARQQLQSDILDCRPWTEAVLFAAERMARGDDQQKAACAAAILSAFEVDPLIAAEMIFRVTDEVWHIVATDVQAFVKRWHSPGKVDRAFRFMLTTGRPEFLDSLWPLLTHQNDQVHLRALRAADRFRTSVLGSDAARQLAGLPVAIRHNVLHEIASHSGMDGLELATKVAKSDADPNVKVGVAEALSFRRADRHLIDLLREADDAIIDQLARKSYLGTVDDAECRRRLEAARERFKAASTSVSERLWSYLRDEPTKADESEIAQLIIELDVGGTEAPNRHLIWKLNQCHPQATAEGLLGRLRADKELFYGSDDILAAAGYALEDDKVLERALASLDARDDLADAASSVLGAKSVGKMIDVYLDVSRRVRKEDGSFDQAAADRRSTVLQRLAQTPAKSLVAAIVVREGRANDAELACLAKLLSRPRNEGGADRSFDLDELATIRNLAQNWAGRLLRADGISRFDKASIVRMIGHAPAVELLPIIKDLLDDELRRYDEFREAAKASQWADRDAVTQAQQPLAGDYQRALIAIRSPESDAFVAEYLTHEHFGENAANVLAEHWTEANEPRNNSFIGGVDFSRVRERRARRLSNPYESCPEADAIFGAVEALIQEGTDDQQHRRAVVLGTIGARLPHGQRSATLEKLYGFASREQRARLLLCRVLSGEEIPIDLVAQGLDDTFEAAKEPHKAWILTQSDSYQVRDWLRLLPFATPVTRLPEILARLQEVHRSPHMLEEAIRNLKLSPEEGCETVLFHLAEADPRLYADYHWRQSVMGVGGETMARRIIDLTLSGALNGKSRDEWHWRRELAGLIRQHPTARAYIHELLKDGPINEELATLAHALAEEPDTEDVVLLVKVEIATKRAFLNSISVEHAVTMRVASEAWRGAYDMVPVPATELRKQLLSLTTDGSRDDPAARCLTEIDKARDQYGAPENEPRHPDIMAGRAWPILVPNPEAELG